MRKNHNKIVCIKLVHLPYLNHRPFCSLWIPALGCPLSNSCCRCAGIVWQIGYRPANRGKYVCGAVHFSQSASTMTSGDTDLIWVFGNAWLKKKRKTLSTRLFRVYQGREQDDKFLARPERKQATANKLGIYSTHPPRSSINFLARCSNLCKKLKKSN